jgi:hypothetical protein
LDFHNQLYYEHLILMFSIISRGDFSEFFAHLAIIQRGLDKPENWKLKLDRIPSDPREADSQLYDLTMFEFMVADRRWKEGEGHPWDIYLDEEIVPGLPDD